MSAQTAPPPQQSGVVQYPPPQPVTTAPMQGMPVRPAMRNPQMRGLPQSQPPPQAGNQYPLNYAQQPVPMVPVPRRPNMLMPANAIPPTQGIPPTTNYPSRQQPMQVDMAEPTSALSAGGSPGQGLKSADIQTRLTRLEKTLEMLQHAHRNLTMRCDNLNSEPIVRAMSDKLLDSFPHARQAEKEIKNAWGEIGSLKQKINDMGLKQGEIQKAVEALTSKGVRENGDAMELSRGERRAAGLGLAGEEAEEVWNEMQLERDRLNNEIGLANSGVDEVRLKMETEFGEVRELRGVVKKVEDGLEGVRGEVKVLWQEVGDLQKGAKRPAAAAALDSGVTATGLNGRKRPRTDAVATEGDEVLEGEQP
ncbi:hypothetical protein KEM55_008685 [Ascosphaera atra]|nr:hypothetical protein KEM55_008685 [Ascosphaera atra]